MDLNENAPLAFVIIYAFLTESGNANTCVVTPTSGLSYESTTVPLTRAALACAIIPPKSINKMNNFLDISFM